MNSTNSFRDYTSNGVQRVRLSEWARMQGISRLTAYRMLKRDILPVPSECSPTGRWYVLLNRSGPRMALYTRSVQGPDQVDIINAQIAVLSEWATQCQRPVFTVTREIADPFVDPMPRLERLLADRQITEIAIDTPSIVGVAQLSLIKSALAPQGRTVTAINSDTQHSDLRQQNLQSSMYHLCKLIYGPRTGVKIASQMQSYAKEGLNRKGL